VIQGENGGDDSVDPTCVESEKVKNQDAYSDRPRCMQLKERIRKFILKMGCCMSKKMVCNFER